MANADEQEMINGIKEWAEKWNRRGHVFARWNRDKGIVERDVSGEFARSLSVNFGVNIGTIETRSPPHPDCLASGPLGQVTIELTELVDTAALAVSSDIKNVRERAEWSKDRLHSALESLILPKGLKPYPSGLDVLLIFSDLDLGGALLSVLSCCEIAQPQTIRNAFLLLTGGLGDQCWPLYQLYREPPSTWFQGKVSSKKIGPGRLA